MTKYEAKAAGAAHCPVECGGILYTYIRAIEYDCITKAIRLQLYDRDAHSITTAPVETVRVSTPGEYASYKERRERERDAFEQLLAERGTAK